MVQLKTIRKFISVFGTDLTLKTSGAEREALKFTCDETIKIFSCAGVCKLEDYLLQYIMNKESFGNALKKCLALTKVKALNGTILLI